MNRVSVDIGGTFTDCFVAWGDRVVEAKSLTTHHNLAVGFNDALADACRQLEITPKTLLSQVDSVRYATSGTASYSLVRASGQSFEGMTNPGATPVAAAALQLLRRYGLFEEYEDRFFAVARRRTGA